MKQEEKQRKFHESLLQMLYPSPPHQEDKVEDKEFIVSLNHLPEEELENEEGCSLQSSGDDNEKMTRAQRKRLRKKKLKEDASRRRKIIGPLLPDSSDVGNNDNVDVVEDGSLSVRQNASTNALEPASCSKQKKVKQRRKSKKVAGKTLNSSSIESNPNNQSLVPEYVKRDDRTEP